MAAEDVGRRQQAESALVTPASDFAERHRVETALRASQERLRLATDAAELGIWVWDLVDGNVTWENDHPYAIFGIARTEPPIAAARFKAEFVHPEDGPIFEAAVARTLEADAPMHFLGRIRRADGAQRWVEFTGRLQRGADGSPVRMVGTAADVTERQFAQEALRESQAQSDRQRRLYEAILGNTPDLAYVFDRNHNFIYANQGLLTMWGRTWEEAIGRNCLQLGYEPWHAAMHDREIDRVVATGQPIRGEVPFTGTFGRRDYDYIFVPVFDANGEVEAVAGTTRDVTDRKKADADREALLASERTARTAAERASVVKEEFLAMLSHELRTPINAIVGWTHILRNRTAPPETLEQGLAVIDRNARIQAQLIADLLDMSRIISGKMRIEVERIELPVVIHAALESVRPAAEAKEVSIDTTIDPITDIVTGDPVRLQQIAWNLLSNAIKFTPRGGRVQVRVASVGGQVEIAISDTGRGIGAEFLPHVFERFRQADSSIAREYTGLGLGLAIVKQLVELHGGTVEASSGGQDRGATFVVRLPVVAAETLSDGVATAAARTADAAAEYAPPDLDGVTVLVVDDEPEARELVRLALEECRAHVVLASSADDALQAMMARRPDVILADIGLPERDGYAFMHAVRRRGIRTPAAALTAFGSADDRRRALYAGFQAHVPKPVERVDLLATVASLAHRTAVSGSGDDPEAAR